MKNWTSVCKSCCWELSKNGKGDIQHEATKTQRRALRVQSLNPFKIFFVT